MNPTSAMYWHPIVSKLRGINVPKTILIQFDEQLVWDIESNEPMNEICPRIAAACETIKYPCFFRTDFASAKHEGPSSYLITQESDIPTIVYKTIMDNLMKDQMPSAFMVREYLHLFAPFKAFGGHPIAKEFRFFTKNGRYVCHHFYWPEAAIKFYRPEDEAKAGSWKAKLRVMNNLSPMLIHLLKLQVNRIGRALTESKGWSLDFAQDVDGKYWFIDAAEGFKSWHQEDCPKRKGFYE